MYISLFSTQNNPAKEYTPFSDEETDLRKIEASGQTMLASKSRIIAMCHLMMGIHPEKCVIR